MLLPLAAALVLAAAPAAALDAPGPCGPVDRGWDVVEVEGRLLKKLGGTSIADLGLLAVRHGRAEAVPFQVDEKRGRRIALPGGPDPTTDDRPGVIDAEDLLVFLPCDAGERATPEMLADAVREAGPARAWREIRLRDPRSGREAFAYVVVGTRPPASPRRYVAYDDAVDLVTTARYRVGLVQALPRYFALSIAGGPGPNLIDGLRLRASATFLANLARWHLNERKGEHALIAWKAGPVRVIRRSRHWVAIGLGIRITAGIAHTYFYPQHVHGPGSLKLPFSPSVFFRDITAFGGADGRDLQGWRYHAAGTPTDGFAIDGEMDDAERKWEASGDWFALAHEKEALLFVTRMSENLARQIPLHLVYRDDAATPYPPEDDAGTVPLVGYEGRHVEKLTRGKYHFELSVYALPGYRAGDEKPVLGALDTPLAVDVPSGGEALTAPAAPGAVPADRP
jgi:hypothetical protein